MQAVVASFRLFCVWEIWQLFLGDVRESAVIVREPKLKVDLTRYVEDASNVVPDWLQLNTQTERSTTSSLIKPSTRRWRAVARVELWAWRLRHLPR